MLLDRCVLEVRTTVIQCMVDKLRREEKKVIVLNLLNLKKKKKVGIC